MPFDFDFGGGAGGPPGYSTALNLAATQVSHEADQNRTHSDMTWAAQFNSDMAVQSRDWQQYMRSTAYQASMADMEAAGLNPILMATRGATMTPTTGDPSISAPGAYGGSPAMENASATMLASAEAAKIRAETREIEARTPTHQVTRDQLQQQITESQARVEKYIQETQTSKSTAANLEADTTNKKELIAQIRMTIQNLVAHAELMRSQGKEVDQRVSAGIPNLQAILHRLEISAEQLSQPGQEANAAAQSSFVGQLGAYLRQILPMNAFINTMPSGGTTVNRTYNIKK